MGARDIMTSQNRPPSESKKKKKFVPAKIPRYLPGSVQNTVLVQDLIEYNKHRYKVFSAQKRVDDNPPNLDISQQVNRTTLAHDSRRLIEIAKENRMLLIRINRINKTKGMIDSYNPDAYNLTSQWKYRQNEMRVIEEHNRAIYRRIKETKSNYNIEDAERHWRNTVEKLKHTCKYPLLILQKKLSLDAVLNREPSISAGLARAKTHFYCFMEFYVPKHQLCLGRIIIELYQDFAPVTVQNFMSICKGDCGLTYERCQIHNIVRGQCIETGDITLGNGKGGASIYGQSFYEESHILQHTRMGIVSMIRKGENQNDSKFCITLAKMDKFNDKRVVFGKVIKGNPILTAIESLGNKIGKPPMAIIISKCGEHKM